MGEYREARVPGVGVLWRSSGDSSVGILPADGSADLILRDDALIVAGPSTRAFSGHGGQHAETVGLRFLPGLAGATLGLSAGELRDVQLPAADVLSPALHSRAAALLRAIRDTNAADVANRSGSAAAVRTACDERFNRSHPDHRLEGSSWAGLARQEAAHERPVTELAAALSVSERQLHRRMLEHFGYGYATLRRVLRAQRAQGLLRAGLRAGDAAARAGYSDQAHLSREFRVIVGSTPTEYAAAQSPGSAA